MQLPAAHGIPQLHSRRPMNVIRVIIGHVTSLYDGIEGYIYSFG